MNSVNDFLMRPITRVSQAESKRYERDTTMTHAEIEEAIRTGNEYHLSQNGYIVKQEVGGVIIRLGKTNRLFRVSATSKIIGYSNVEVIAKLEDRKYTIDEVKEIISASLNDDEMVGHTIDSDYGVNHFSISSSKTIKSSHNATLDELGKLCELHGEIHLQWQSIKELAEQSRLKFPHLKEIISDAFIPGDNNLLIQYSVAKITPAWGKMIKYRLKKQHGGPDAVRKKNPKLVLKQAIMRHLVQIIGNFEHLLRNGTCTVWYKTSGDLETISCFIGNVNTIRCILISNTGKNTHTNKQDKGSVADMKSAIGNINQLNIRGLSKVKMGKYVTPDHLKNLYKAFDKVKEFGAKNGNK